MICTVIMMKKTRVQPWRLANRIPISIPTRQGSMAKGQKYINSTPRLVRNEPVENQEDSPGASEIAMGIQLVSIIKYYKYM